MEQLKYLFDNAKVGMAICNAKNNRLEMVNPAFARIHGYEPHELIGVSPGEVFAPECMVKLHAHENAPSPSCAINDVSFETVHTRKDGSSVPVAIHITVIKDEIGTVKHRIANVQDISERKIQEEILETKEQKFRVIAENLPGFAFTYRLLSDGRGELLYVSHGIADTFGIKPETALCDITVLLQVIHPEDQAGLRAAISASAQTMEPLYVEFRVIHPEKGVLWLEARAMQGKRETDGSIVWHGIALEITERKELEKDLKLREQMFRTLAENSPNIIMRYDTQCRRIYANPAYSKQTGISLDAALDEKFSTVWESYLGIPMMNTPTYLKRIKKVIQSGEPDSCTVEWYRIGDGMHITHNLHIVAERDENGTIIGALAIGHDITEQKKIEHQIEHMANHDWLTGLPNRIFAKNKAEQIIAHAEKTGSRAALLFIDLDGFKSVNDTLGHSAGDTMLTIIASRIQETINGAGTISRQGGDEFLLILPEVVEIDDITHVTEKLLSVFEQPFNILNHNLSASASIGIALYPDDGNTFEVLLQNADTAMYQAKESGKNTYCFYTQKMNHNLIGQFKLQNDLKSALYNNEFELYYQPQIDLKNNRIMGAEALIRWNHPQLGIIPPMDFIPIAESSGLIVQIGEWVLQEACRQGSLWHMMGMEITVAVNISAVQFKRANLESVIQRALTSSGLNPRFLELELTESVLIHDTETIFKTVHAIKGLGVQLSIDDFGTGYSSLAYLKRFAVDKLKIDQSFVRDILSDQDDAAIVRTIIQMAQNLHLKTIAEGVENEEVLALIDSYGCDEVQGYHFAKPMDAVEFDRYYASMSK